MSNQSIHTYWVNSFKLPCTGVAPSHCLQIQKDVYRPGGWTNFYSGIEGFDFQPGYLYRLEVEETRLPPNQVPADASSIRHRLVRVLEKKADERYALNDIWVLESWGEPAIPYLRGSAPKEVPRLEVLVAGSSVMGHDGCGSYQGTADLDHWPAIQFKDLKAETLPCTGDSIPSAFRAALMEVRGYRREGLRLILTNAHDIALLRFRKVD